MKILIVEDNPGDYEFIQELLNSQPDMAFDVLTSHTLEDAKCFSVQMKPDVILLDLGLPDSFGIETAQQMICAVPNIPVIVLTGMKGEETGLTAIAEGAQDFLSKNELNEKNLIRSIRYSLERKKYLDDLKITEQKISYLLDYSSDGVCVVDNDFSVQEANSAFGRLFNINSSEIINKEISQAVSEFAKPVFLDKTKQVIKKGKHQAFDYNYDSKFEIWYEVKLDPYPNGIIIFVRDISDRVAEQNTLSKLNESLRKSTNSTISLLAELVELKEPYTAGHQERVAYLCELIADYIGISDNQKTSLILAAKIHDIGKTAVPSEILVKPTSLSKNEMNLVRHHVLSGYNLVKKMDIETDLSKIILQHHERVDGSGYPYGVMGNEMLLESKVIAVADVVDAMLSHRPYRTAFSKSDVINELEKNISILYDKSVVQACIHILNKGHFKPT